MNNGFNKCISIQTVMVAIALLTIMPAHGRTPISSPHEFPDTVTDNPISPESLDSERYNFARSIIRKLSRHIKTRHHHKVVTPEGQLIGPPDISKYNRNATDRVLFIYYLPGTNHPYRYFIACSRPDPETCEQIDLGRWQNQEGRFQHSANRVAEFILGESRRFNQSNHQSSGFNIASLFGLGSDTTTPTVSVSLSDTRNVETNGPDTPISSGIPAGQISAGAGTFEGKLREEPPNLPDAPSPPSLKLESSVHRIIMLISQEKFERARKLLNQLGPEARNHPRLKNLIRHLDQLVKLSLNEN